MSCTDTILITAKKNPSKTLDFARLIMLLYTMVYLLFKYMAGCSFEALERVGSNDTATLTLIYQGEVKLGS